MSDLLFLRNHETLLDRIRRGDEAALVALYRENERSVRSFVRRNNGSQEEADDMLQEALVIFWERVRTNRFELHAKPGTFIYATVRNLWLRNLARKRREVTGTDAEIEAEDTSMSSLHLLISQEEISQVRKALMTMNEPCRSLLTLFYWQECSMEEIAGKLGFANAQTAKAKKYQCKEALKKALLTIGVQP